MLVTIYNGHWTDWYKFSFFPLVPSRRRNFYKKPRKSWLKDKDIDFCSKHYKAKPEVLKPFIWILKIINELKYSTLSLRTGYLYCIMYLKINKTLTKKI